MATEFTAASGAKVKIDLAPFVDAMALKNAITKTLADGGISFGSKGIALDTDIDVGAMLGHIMRLDSSPEVNAAIFKCLERCTYNNFKITHDTFEGADARQDYYDVVTACVKENIAPFFKGLVSKLNGLGAMIPSQGQK